jgi:hypothetical protein
MKIATLIVYVLLSVAMSPETYSQPISANLIRVGYYTQSGIKVDDIIVRFLDHPGVTNWQYGGYDAVSWNSGSYLASYKGTWKCAIQTRPMDFISDTVRLMVGSTSTGNFKFVFSQFEKLAETKDIILIDNYEGTNANVKLNTEYAFAINADPDSKGSHRFKLAFKTAPFICARNIEVNQDAGLNGAFVSFAVTTIRSCTTAVINYSHAPGSLFPVGITTVNVTADVCGEVWSCSFTVTVRDVEVPVLTCPDDVYHSTDPRSALYRFIPAAPAASDNVGAIVTGVRDDGLPLDAPYKIGTTEVNWTASDAAGNSASCKQKIIVTDNEPPTINCADFYVNANYTGCKYFVSGEFDPQYFDNDPNTVAKNSYNNGSTLAGVELPLGETTITWVVTDGAGNSASCQSVITVGKTITTNIPGVTAIPGVAAPNTIYQGYAPATRLLYTAQASGGQINYQWSAGPGLFFETGSSEQAVTITGISASTLTVTATNELGCSASATTQVNVIDLTCMSNRVSICRRTGNTYTSLCVAQNGVSPLLATGAVLGSCPSGRPTGQLTAETTAELIAYPNPTKGVLHLQIMNYRTGKAEVQIIDMLGKVVDTRLVTIMFPTEKFDFDLTRLPGGIFHIRVINSEGVRFMKIVLAP